MLISVVMSVYNGQKFLAEAIESILKQTYTNFEFIIIDDGSTDNSLDIVWEFAAADERIRVVVNETNLGLAKSLNKGIALASGKYIARMDADDISMPERFEKQVAFLDENDDIGLVGTNKINLDQITGQEKKYLKIPEGHLEILWTLLFTPPFIHPSVMIRRSFLLENNLRYSEELQAAQDYDLWMRSLSYTKGANLSEFLLIYRVHNKQITGTKRAAQLENHVQISFQCIKTYLPKIKINIEEVKQILEEFCAGFPATQGHEKYQRQATLKYTQIYTAFISKYGFIQKSWRHDKIINSTVKSLLKTHALRNSFSAVYILTFYWLTRMKIALGLTKAKSSQIIKR